MENKDPTRRPRKVTVKDGSVKEQEFAQSRIDELNILLDDGIFEETPK